MTAICLDAFILYDVFVYACVLSFDEESRWVVYMYVLFAMHKYGIVY